MDNTIPQFGELKRHSNSPVPLRSPSPDIVIKSAIINTTPPPNVLSQNKQLQNYSFREQNSILKTQIKRLKRAVQQKGDKQSVHALINMNKKLEQKDKIIDALKIQLRALQHQNQRINIIISNNSNNQHLIDQIKTLKQKNTKFTAEVSTLILYKQQYYKLQSSIINNQIPANEQDILNHINTNIQSRIVNEQIQSIKRYFQNRLQQHLNQINNVYDTRLNNVQKKILLIQDNIHKIKNILNKSKINNYSNSTNINTPINQPYKQYELNQEIQQFRFQNQRLRKQQFQLKLKYQSLQKDNKDKQQKIINLMSMISRSNENSMIQDSKYKKQLIDQNKKLKLNISDLSKQIVDLKNQKVYYIKQIQIMKKRLENQKQLSNSQTQKNQLRLISSQFQQQKIKNQKLTNKNQSLNDTLDELRRTYNNTQNEIDQYRVSYNQLKISYKNLQTYKNQIEKKIKQNSSIQVQTQTDNLKLRLRINQLERELAGQSSLQNHIENLKKQLLIVQNYNKQLKFKLSQSESNFDNYNKQVLKNISLNDQIETLKHKILDLQRSIQQVLKGSDHTKNEFIRLNNQKAELQNQIIQLRSNIGHIENDLYLVQQKLMNIQKEYNTLQQQYILITRKQNQAEERITILNQQKNNLSKDYQILLTQYHVFQQQKISFQVEKGKLIEEINIRQSHLNQEIYHRNNISIIERQRTENLNVTLAELIQVKRILQSMNFDSILDVFKELHLQQVLIQKHKQQNQQIKNTLTLENDKLRKQNLQAKHTIITLQENVQYLKNLIIQLQSDNKIMNQKNIKLDQIIRNYVYQQTEPIASGNQFKQIEKRVRFQDDNFRNQINQVQRLRQPVKYSVVKLEEIINKIQYINTLKDTHIVQTHIIQTHSQIISNFDLQQSTNSRQI